MVADNVLGARLVFKESDFQAFRSHLLQADQMERAGFLFLGNQQADGLLELYVHRMLLPSDEDYCEQHQVVVEPRAEYVLDTFARFGGTCLPGYLHAHSHPFSPNGDFSSIDDHYFPGMQRSLGRYLLVTGQQRQFLFVRLVWGRNEAGFTAGCYAPDGSLLASVDEIRIVGKHGIRTVSSFSAPKKKTDMQETISRQFQRQVEFLGATGQHSIQATHLVVCGVGGLGSLVVACAKGLGFRAITIIDPDVVEESNLNRFQGATLADVGRHKVDVVSEAVTAFDPMINVRPIQACVQDSAAHHGILDADFIVNCLDNDSARMEVQILAASYLKPLLDLGSGIMLETGTRTVREMGGQAILYVPGGPCLLCQGLDPCNVVSNQIREVQRAVGYIQGTDETPASVVTHNLVMAGLGLQLITNYVTGFAEVPLYLRCDMLQHRITQHDFVKRPDCPICGEQGIEGKGDEPKVILPYGGRGTRLPSAVAGKYQQVSSNDSHTKNAGPEIMSEPSTKTVGSTGFLSKLQAVYRTLVTILNEPHCLPL